MALLADKSVWHYSLDDLAWVRRPEKRSFAHLVPAAGRLYAVEADTGKVLRYTPAADVPDAPPALWAVKAEGDGKKGFRFE